MCLKSPFREWSRTPWRGSDCLEHLLWAVPETVPMAKERKTEEASAQKKGARLLTVQGAASYLAVSVSTLYGWVWQRRIPFVKVGRALRFDIADLERLIEESRVKSDSGGFSGK